MIHWSSPLGRREISLLLFSLAVFIVAYNFHSVLSFFGADFASSIFLHFPPFSTSLISADGRKPPGWRDRLERGIFGDWDWDEGHVASDTSERSRAKGHSKYGAIWLGRAKTGVVAGEVFGEEVVNGVMRWWGDDVPKTSVLKHTPGFTILDSAILLNQTMFMVADDPNSLPEPELIASWTANSRDPLQVTDWQIINSTEAMDLLGESGGIIRGVSWMSTDTTLHPAAILTLHRLHTTMSRTTRSAQRLLLPHIPTFTFLPYHLPHTTPRFRTPLPAPLHHPFMLKTAFPRVGVEYKEDWDDYCLMELPWVFERLVVADSGAAWRAGAVTVAEQVFTLESDAATAREWWEPVRTTVLRSLKLPLDAPSPAARPVITYISRQNASYGPMFQDADHTALVRALRKSGWEVEVIEDGEGDGEEAGGVWAGEGKRWERLMKSVLRSTVVLGVHGSHLLSGAFMRPSARSTVMEFFPSDTFTRETQAVVTALELRYIAWCGAQKFAVNDLPPSIPPPPFTETEFVPIDVRAVVQSIREEVSR